MVSMVSTVSTMPIESQALGEIRRQGFEYLTPVPEMCSPRPEVGGMNAKLLGQVARLHVANVHVSRKAKQQLRQSRRPRHLLTVGFSSTSSHIRSRIVREASRAVAPPGSSP